MGRVFRCNLHLHTCLSPCGDLDMHPAAIVPECIRQGLDVIAVCDHNASENVRYVLNAAEGTGLVVIPGMEVCTREEVHLVALFDAVSALATFQEFVYANLPGTNSEDAFGVQAIVNEKGEVEGFNEHLLIGAADISLNAAVDHIHALGGLAIPSHIDRPGFGLLGQLGFVPPDVPFDALEVSAGLGIAQARQRYPELRAYQFVTASDAHFLHDIGRACTRMYLESPSFFEIRLALMHHQGRFVLE
ncbi:MAG TPA: PHP domain-containing protein [Deltaproteobacteria bacterium]|nr:PHP domain-containing protein [Deltaproteobacteria bacterium]